MIIQDKSFVVIAQSVKCLATCWATGFTSWQ